jgi:hypothetical protein
LLGFVTTGSDTSLFVLRRGADTAWLLLYVDDIVLTASSPALLHQIVHDLRGAFAMKDLGPLHYFLGIQVRWTTEGFFLHQQQYAEDILDHVGTLNCKRRPCPSTPRLRSLLQPVFPSRTRPTIEASPGLFNISRSPCRNLLMPCNKHACTCTILATRTGISSRVSSGTFMELLDTVLSFEPLPPPP